MNYRKIMNNNELNPIEKVVNYKFGYFGTKDDMERTYYLDESSNITFDDLKKLSLDKTSVYFDRNFKILKDRFAKNLTYKELSKKYDVSTERARCIVLKTIKNIFYYPALIVNEESDNRFTFKFQEEYMSEEKYKGDTDINTVGLSVRAYNVLARSGIADLIELEGKKYSELLKIRNLGKTVLIEIVNLCDKCGINLINDVLEDGKLSKDKLKIIKLENKYREAMNSNKALKIKTAQLEVENRVLKDKVGKLTQMNQHIILNHNLSGGMYDKYSES